MLSEQGRQYSSWRGTTRFEAELRQDRVRHLKSRPHHPMTLGKIEQVARTSALEVRGSDMVRAFGALYSRAVSRRRRPFLSDRFFFVTVRLLKRRREFEDADFQRLARAAHPWRRVPGVRGLGLPSRQASPAALLRVEPPASYPCQHLPP